MKRLQCVFFAVTFVFFQCLYAEGSPLPMLEQSANQIISALKQNKASLKSNPKIIHQTVRQYLLPIVDVNGMSRSVLGRKVWSAASNEERAKFCNAFTQLVIRTYATPLAEFSDEKVKFLPQRMQANNQFSRVNSVIVRPSGQNIPLSYSLVSKNGQWKIYDLSVEGVSLLQSFRNQFGQALQHSTINELIDQMNKNKRVS